MDNCLQEISILDRKDTNCEKWDSLKETFGQDDLLPLWVADMDFKAPLCVREALHQAVEAGVFGYYHIPDAFYDSILSWEQRRHQNTLDRSWLRFSAGVVTGLFHLVQALTQPGDAVMVLKPVYYPFYRVIGHTGRRGVFCPLQEDRGIYTLDMALFEEKIVREQVKVFLLCSPQNPVGRVWTETELSNMLTCCRRHGVKVISDEIHHDLVMPGHRHLPAIRFWEGEGRPITLFSASKTFNLAGMKTSVLVLPEPWQREAFDRFEKTLGGDQSSNLDYVAVAAAFQGGDAWLETVLAEVWKNFQYMKKALAPFPQVVVSPLEGTYLMWLDLGRMVPGEKLHDFMQNSCHIAPDYGHWFFPDNEASLDTHIRLNLAAPHETIRRAAEQLVAGLRSL